ncbi:type VI secretion system baseplate subunit TssK [Ideonella sp. 4Y16]|uniref:Type VI secretion system baseplate subunit TssK n=1 Tax=Ideonella alba TaxID=2824118 RepID=A0A941BGC9_9BURK|nr:type VI secretion system baseplate subunit TssK [Ideonella alba]MBQ0930393.1 type VI secretion system baseplate subunit TssK [Ideonella alba]MBQ0946252.1 type VI secretion system baseplate subunit TssK [Ideonella alba]
MTWQNKVIWAEGMFLQPQHFQQHDRYLAAQDHARQSALLAYSWGFVSLQLDNAALNLGKIAINAAVGLMPDGQAFDIPSQDAAPAALDVPPDARDELVVLALTLPRPGVAETDAEGDTPAMPPRFLATEVDVGDSNATGERAAPLQIGRVNLRLMLARDAAEGYATLGLCRIIERRADNKVTLDTQFIPPTLHAGGNDLLAGYLRELHGLLHQRGEALAARLAQPGRAGVGEIADFLLLEAVNRHEPLLAQMRQCSVLHPRELYFSACSLAGDLSTFGERRRPPALPAYLHDDPQRCFKPLMDALRQSLSMVLEQNAIPIELQERAYGVRVAIIADIELQRSAQFVLAVGAQLPGDALRARFPTQVKIGPVERIRDLVNLQLPGVTLRPMPVAPRQIPYHAGFNYFELETRGNELWKQLESSGGLALHIAGEFPGLELEFWAVRG